MFYVISDRDYARLQKLLRAFESGRLTIQRHYRHRRGGIGGGGSAFRIAYAKTDAGTGTTLTCYLDEDLTGEEITVNFMICGGSNLNASIPRLSLGDPLFVINKNGTWYGIPPWQASQDCA